MIPEGVYCNTIVHNFFRKDVESKVLLDTTDGTDITAVNIR